MSQTFFEQAMQGYRITLDIAISKEQHYEAAFAAKYQDYRKGITSSGQLSTFGTTASFHDFIKRLGEYYRNVLAPRKTPIHVHIQVFYNSFLHSIETNTAKVLSMQNWEDLLIETRNLVNNLLQFSQEKPNPYLY
jgi:hypothetical protein